MYLVKFQPVRRNCFSNMLTSLLPRHKIYLLKQCMSQSKRGAAFTLRTVQNIHNKHIQPE